MKKILATTLGVLTIFLFVSAINAQTSTSTSTPVSTSTTSSKKYIPLKKNLKSKKSAVKVSKYQKCKNEKMRALTKELQSRKKTALSEYKSALKSATSTSDRSLARKNYNSKIREINKWFTNAVKSAKQECRELKTSTSTTSTATSTATSSQ